MSTILRVLLPLGILAVGLMLAAGMLLASVLLLAFWSLRALYLRLTGRRVPPFTVRFRPPEAFRGARRGLSEGDVIDVEAKHLSWPGQPLSGAIHLRAASWPEADINHRIDTPPLTSA
jgi:hypothetical protein